MLRAADWVEVRAKHEILRSLDSQGRLDGLPFMPQMFKFCGQRFQVFKRAHKTCDTVNGTRGRRLEDTVHLEVRCDGAAYGGCEAACLIFWKEAWLKNVDGPSAPDDRVTNDAAAQVRKLHESVACTEDDVWKAVRRFDKDNPGNIQFACQATELPNYTTRLRWWDLRQYWEDYRSGNASLGAILAGAIYATYYTTTQSHGDALARPFRRLYDGVQSLWNGVPFPRRRGRLPVGSAVAIADLNLEPGELVRIKSYAEILATLDTTNKNRGLYFDAEMVPFCGGTYRVKGRVNKFLNEKTGKLTTLKTPAVILENVWCQARYSDCRMFCPRAIYSWWREAWLERVPDTAAGTANGARCGLGHTDAAA